MRVMLMANWGIGREVLAALLSYPWVGIDRVVTNDPIEPATSWNHAVSDLAHSTGLIVDHKSDWQHADLAHHLSQNVDLLITHAWPDILPPAVFSSPRACSVNIHPSLLPRYRGPSPHLHVYKNRDAATGLTCHIIDAGIDTGPIIAQQSVRLSGRETLDELIDLQKPLVRPLLDETFRRLSDPMFKPVPQDESGASYAHKTDRTAAT